MTSTWWTALSGAIEPTGEPLMQVAADGRWEQAAVAHPTTARGELAALVERVAAQARDDVAVEVLWPAGFAGVRWRRERHRDAAAAAVSARTAATVASALLALLGTDPGAAVERVDAGAVNAWQTVGPLSLWRRGEPADEDAVVERLYRRPDLRDCAHPVAVELSVGQPLPCWIGVVVSTPVANGHRLDERRLRDALRRCWSAGDLRGGGTTAAD